jgi:hypothetical protein
LPSLIEQAIHSNPHCHRFCQHRDGGAPPRLGVTLQKDLKAIDSRILIQVQRGRKRISDNYNYYNKINKNK